MKIFLPQRKKFGSQDGPHHSITSITVETREALLIRVYSVQPNVYFRVNAKYILPSGELKLMSCNFNAMPATTLLTFRIPLTCCLLQSVTIEVTTLNVVDSVFFVSVYLMSSNLPSGFPIALLISGCVTSNTPLCFPTDRPRHSLEFSPRTIVTNAPLLGPGTPIFFQNTPGIRSRIVAAYITLETDATVVNRYLYCALYDPTISPLVSCCATPQTAGVFQYYNFAELHPPIATPNFLIVPLARGFLLEQGEQFYIAVFNMQAGDVISDANLLIEQQISI